MFEFPALAAGPPSRRNWYKELLDHPDCNGSAVKVQEAYEAHRQKYSKTQADSFLNAESNPVTADKALISHLDRQSRLGSIESVRETEPQEINCCVIWARPSPSVLSLIRKIQTRIYELLGSDLHMIPTEDMHLSVIELSHRHSVPQLRAVADEVGKDRIQKMLDMLSELDVKPGLLSPRLNFDKMGIALNLLPSAEDAYTWHHLRSDMHALALESGVSIDMCYTAPSAHLTLGRFIGNEFFEKKENVQKFLDLVQVLNSEIEKEMDLWRVGQDQSLELQLGYLKFGRPRSDADMLGK